MEKQQTDFNIGHVLQQLAEELDDKTALICRRGRDWGAWNFAELTWITRDYNLRLKDLGVAKGDRVMLMVKPSVEFISLTFALFQLGAVVILIDPGMGFRNLLRCIGSVRPDVLIGIPKAVLLSLVFRRPFHTLRLRISVGKSFWWKKYVIPLAAQNRLSVSGAEKEATVKASFDDLAAIIFTTGSTGPPKGVQYTHGIFHTQLQYIRDYFGISSSDTDQPGFPLFGLFSIALGATAVIPDMDPTRPAKVDPVKFVASIQKYGVTYSFGSPAIWRVVARYCFERNVHLGLRKILMAGAPVPGELIEQLQQILPDDAEIFTPYGATESLPIVCMEGREIIEDTWQQTVQGAGTCVGRALPGIEIRIIEPSEQAIESWHQVTELGSNEIGEIVAKGPVVTRAYDGNENQTHLAKIMDSGSFWHRMGDMGYLDDQSRLWFCGRKAHRVICGKTILYSVMCEAVFNQHPAVYRSALVGVGEQGNQQPVIIVEPVERIQNEKEFFIELQNIADKYEHTACIKKFLVHTRFPVDIRHNAKIFREKLADWAAGKIGNSC
ncbi:fatty acid CoA ligase family protein [Desulfogranum japonicum]|uniref:fatty acid CoA ligase family protein n=1 Tax=Desulfogranum japonicum TaxID=231447 RepID=UPI0004197D66|nr:fatty acid CoA ligase family protein [Desulfogranum japonicum]